MWALFWLTLDEFIYWSADEVPPNGVIYDTNIPTMLPRDYHPNLAQAVSATSYALMLYLYNNMLADSTPILKWLISQHNDFMRLDSGQVNYIIIIIHINISNVTL